MSSNKTDSVVYDASKQKRSPSLIDTASTIVQQETEYECAPYFVDLSKLGRSDQNDLRRIGLLPKDANDEHPLDICLLYDKHGAYLSRAYSQFIPLGSSMSSLDASRPWMIYWSLHACDLLDRMPQPPEDLDQEDDVASTLFAIVTTLEACWKTVKLELPLGGVANVTEQDSFQPWCHDDSKKTMFVQGGGFGGGPGQMPHCATTYAAVLSLCIIATSTEDTKASLRAFQVLERIRKPLYAWFLSLQEPSGAFRVHHDGEMDVRASYIVFVVAKLLNIYTPSLAHPTTIQYIASCQTYEGGFSAEPFTEAHGGYAFCAVAALYLSLQKDEWKDAIDLPALRGWLVRRQTSFEGGFSGRSNKLVDGCYSFWQGGALALLSTLYNNNTRDPWLSTTTNPNTNNDSMNHLLFDQAMLQRYILLCGQDPPGGLRDKPSKPRDFYHSCYTLSGLSISQHPTSSSTTLDYGHPQESRVKPVHPAYNIAIERIQKILAHFA